jgi:hypothetical protein
LKRLLRNSFAGSFKAGCEGYRISKRVDRKVQTKVKCLESEPAAVHFSGADKFGEGVAPNDDDA